MNKPIAAFLIAATLTACGSEEEQMKKITVDNYPETRKDEVADDYFGTKVADPYRWLEDDRSEETEAWVKEQNEVTFGYLDQIDFRDGIRERLTEIWDYPKFSSPTKRGDYYYYFKNDGLQNQSVMYRTNSLDEEGDVFLDPNQLSDDGTVALGSTSFNKDADLMAYSISRSGSDWQEIYVMDVETGELKDTEVKWVKFSGISWKGDGFYYSAYDQPKEGSEYSAKNEYHKVYYHRLGTAQSEDELIWEDKENPLRNFSAGTDEEENYLILNASQGTSGNMVMVKDLREENAAFKPLIDNFDQDHRIIDVIDDELLIMTNLDAPNNRVVKVSAKDPWYENWVDFIPESENKLNGVNFTGGKFFANYLRDASTEILIFDEEGNGMGTVDLPGIGSAGGFGGDKDATETFFSFSSFTQPSTIYRYQIESGEYEVFRESEVKFNPEDFETKRVFYESKDGTKVPMFITHKKGLKMDGSNPTFLYSYGGFNISMTPGFSVARLVWLENGGIYAQPSIRGGGEYGEAWHKGGMKENKQNVFDDFIAAGEYLINEGYTSSERLAVSGGSNGGLLVGAVMTQRPDLFKVALPAVGVLDMLRFHKFTIGWAWAVEYGSSEDSTQFDFLYKYSPLHNLKEGTAYPATMVTTADHDDRVVPAHSFKFAAALQEAHEGENPVLIRIDVKAGHGAGKPTSKVIDQWADVYAFTWQNMGFKPALKK
ncbi:MAG: prolyl oligopeptidase family serine peptidase [Cyclobacteriaceae bacterium]|nr:S9 family peptidase [Cyclobacteriaceae bacterium]MCH8515021.1 prolyl oligopeptidase family serine peptidase [Cyclobacteriaceae bacterium]